MRLHTLVRKNGDTNENQRAEGQSEATDIQAEPELTKVIMADCIVSRVAVQGRVISKPSIIFA